MENQPDFPTSPIVNVQQILDRAGVDIVESRPTLEKVSDTFRTAVVLLLGEHVRFNVDRLARIAGYDRTFVAKAVRRLYDNGVWGDGEVKREWSERELDGSFWRDVAVAEGLLYRREAEDGEWEWGYPGSWWKAYDFGDSHGSGPAVRYFIAAEEERGARRPLEAMTPEEVVGPPEVVEVVEDLTPELAFTMLWDGEPSWALGGSSLNGSTVRSSALYPPVGSTPVGAGASGSSELFPDAVWLR
ncbi:MAG: hypothetical protein GEU90_10100 [Gemmatimonas sp.]|nr:hypothetical protein [Gemmatimonas sp.]